MINGGGSLDELEWLDRDHGLSITKILLGVPA